jgi:hypothetical protein
VFIVDAGAVLVGLVFGLGGPLLFVALIVDEFFGVGERLHEWRLDRELAALARERERTRLRPLVRDGGWAVPNGDTQRLTGGRWWTPNFDTGSLLVVEEEGLFDRYWCTYEMHELAPSLTSAVPMSDCRMVQDLLGDAVQPWNQWIPRMGAVDYPWKPVPAYVDRSLAATAAWVARQGPFSL